MPTRKNLHKYARISGLILMLLLNPALNFAESKADKNDWPNFLGPNHDGISHETEWSADWGDDGPTIAWKANLGAGGSCPAIVGDRIYTMGYINGNDTVYCLNLKDGKTIWKFSYPCTIYNTQHDGGPTCTPAIDGDKVYTLSRDGRMLCFNRDDGTSPTWDRDLKKELGIKLPSFGTTGSPIVDGNEVIIEVGRTMALDKNTGKTVWQTADYGPGYASPCVFSVGDKRYVAVFNNPGPMLVDRADGKEIWKEQWNSGAGHAATPIVLDGDKVLFTAYYDEGSGLLKVGGEKPEYVWRKKKVFMNIFNTPVIHNGFLYGFDGEYLACADAKTGDIKWKTPEKFGWCTLSLADDKLLVFNTDSELFVLQATPEGYKELNRAHFFGKANLTPPVLLRGMLYCRNSKGELVCLDLRKK